VRVSVENGAGAGGAPQRPGAAAPALRTRGATTQDYYREIAGLLGELAPTEGGPHASAAGGMGAPALQMPLVMPGGAPSPGSMQVPPGPRGAPLRHVQCKPCRQTLPPGFGAWPEPDGGLREPCKVGGRGALPGAPAGRR
jgi:hypothetical protein